MEYEVKERKIIKSIPWRETCFGCYEGASEGIGMRAYIAEDGYVVGICKTKEAHQGFPGVVHGGILATYMDEVLWHTTKALDENTSAMTVELNMKYYCPVEVGQEVRIVAMPARFEGKHIYTEGYLLLPDDSVAVRATAHYIAIQKEHFLNGPEKERVLYEQETMPQRIRF